MSKLPAIDRFAARALMVSFFLPAKLQVMVTVAASVYFIARTFRSNQIVPRGNYLWAFILGSCYLLYLFSIPFTPQHLYRQVLLVVCQNRVSYLLMPFVFATIAPSFRKLLTEQLMYFVYACFISCLVGNAAFIYHYCFSNGLHELSHVRYRLMFEDTTGLHPTYMGMYLCFSICITLLISPFRTKKGTVIKYALIYLLLVFLLSLLAKSALIALAIIFIHFLYLRRSVLYRYKILLSGILIGVIAACFFIPFVGQRIAEILSYFGIGKHGSAEDNSVYVRKLIWDVDTSLLKPNWLTGVGPGRMLHMLHERYFFYSLANNFYVGYYDPHNEYFCEWLSFGILGLLVLVATLVIHFLRAIRTKSYLYSYLLIILCTTSFTETVLSRQEGILFYAVFTSLFFFLNLEGPDVLRE